MRKRIALRLGYFVMIAVLCACQPLEGETLALLDEPIAEIRVTESQGMQIIGEEDSKTLFTFTAPKDIAVFEKVLTTAVLHEEFIPPGEPEFHLYVHYEKDLPVHAFHLWLGNDNEQSLLMYMIDETENIYVVSDEMSKQLRALFNKKR